MNNKRQNYMSPITFEAEMFVHSLETLSKTYNHFDAVLVSSLEKVMNAIETFLNSNPNEILATKHINLVKCDDISHITRIYHCSRCKTDLGKSVEKVALHLIEQCTKRYNDDVAAGGGGGNSRQTSETSSGKEAQDHKKSRKDMRKEAFQKKQEQRREKAVKLTKKTCSLLTTDLNKFFVDTMKIGTKLQCIPEYDEIEKDLLNIITPLYPNKNVKIYKFGSRLSGIGTRESDLDLYVDIGDTFNVYQNRADKETLEKLDKVGKALSNHHKTWKGLVKVNAARVPILKIIHARSSIECDINFSNSLGAINTKFLEYIFNLQPIARLLCIFMKKWLNRTSLNNEINTYSIILMVLFYLQTIDVLPSMKRLQENVNPERALTVGPWLCMYATHTLKELNIQLEDTDQQNLLKFIRGFFLFYTNLKFENVIICPYLGKAIKKINFNTLMPKRYTEYVASSADFALKLDKPIIVQDPIQLNHNTTKGLSAFTLITFKTLMIKSLEVINETLLCSKK